MYTFLINTYSQKACGLVQLTKYFTALELKFYLFCGRFFPPPNRRTSSFPSVLWCHGPTFFKANCNGLFLGSVAFAFLTVVSQLLAHSRYSHVCSMNGCNFFKVTQLPSDSLESPGLCMPRLVPFKRKSYLGKKNTVSHENSSCFIIA